MALGWRGGARAALLFSAIIASALWAASEVTVAVWPGAASAIAAHGLDTVRYALWFAFLYGLVSTTRQSAGDAGTKLVRAPWWLIVAVGAGLLASVALPDLEPLCTLFGARAGIVAYGVRVGLSVVGLVLVERLLRSAAPHARWAIKPLCLGLAGIFGFDLFYFADAMLFGHQDLGHLGGAGHCACPGAAFCWRGGGQESGLDDRDALVAGRGAAFERAPDLGPVPSRHCCGRIRRALHRRGAGEGTANRISVRGTASVCAGGVLGQLQVQAEGLRQQALFLVPLRLPRGVAAVHADIFGRQFAAERPAAQRPCARRPGGEPGGCAVAAA